MVIVGFNTTTDPPYWIVRNSWGAGNAGWGMDGYAFIKTDPDNSPGECSMYLYKMYYPTSAALVIDANGNGIDDDLEGQGPPPPPPPPKVLCTGRGYNNFYINRKGGKVMKTVWAKDFNSCAKHTAENKGGIFNFNKKTKQCTMMKGSWVGISEHLVFNKSMMAGYPVCIPLEIVGSSLDGEIACGG